MIDTKTEQVGWVIFLNMGSGWNIHKMFIEPVFKEAQKERYRLLSLDPDHDVELCPMVAEWPITP